jgi:hypothetical protein
MEIRSVKLAKDTLLCDLYNLKECEEDDDEGKGTVQVTGAYRLRREGRLKSLRCYRDDE